jgi:hypothetical protein
MQRRTIAIGVAALAVTCCMAVAATAGSHSAVSPGRSVSVTTDSVNGLLGSPGRSYTLPVVFGMFEERGGPVKPGANGGTPTRPLRGVITFTNKEGRTTAVTAGSNGRFIAQVPTGTYTVTARSPQIEQQNSDGTRSDPSCAGPETVVVRSKTAPTPLTLICYVP